MYREVREEIRKLDTSWIQEGEDDGSSPIIVLLHGFPDNAKSWSKQIDFFKEDYLVLAPYVHGTSERDKFIPKRRYASDSYALDIIEIINRVDRDKNRSILIVGHDIGGVIADKVAQFLGSRSIGIVLINSLGLDQFYYRKKDPFQIFKSYYIGIFQAPIITDGIFKLFNRRMLKFIYDTGGLDKKDEIREHGKEVFRGLQHYRNFAREMLSLRNNIRKTLNTNALYLFGERDKFLELPSVHEAKKFYAHSEVRVINSTHWMHRNDSSTVNRILSKTFNAWLAGAKEKHV
ncbi:hypothetical protein A9Q84_15420 [Halobacteriovorax marinus]|uniref:AB hydrolase-1 domain-containing protein n=1 Tax=Halobacteriovorax marinus TaxID=97084 RepID=A0A1Y5F9K5_9BACT|nr:hypothetical protein A9Q84_15420 [Halobacteriovorax marinus]